MHLRYYYSKPSLAHTLRVRKVMQSLRKVRLSVSCEFHISMEALILSESLVIDRQKICMIQSSQAKDEGEKCNERQNRRRLTRDEVIEDSAGTS